MYSKHPCTQLRALVIEVVFRGLVIARSIMAVIMTGPARSTGARVKRTVKSMTQCFGTLFCAMFVETMSGMLCSLLRPMAVSAGET